MTSILDKMLIKEKKNTIVSDTLNNPNRRQTHEVWEFSGADSGYSVSKKIVATPVFEDKELKGFSVGTYDNQDEHNSQDNKFLSVDEYAELVYKIEKQNTKAAGTHVAEVFTEGLKNWFNNKKLRS